MNNKNIIPFVVLILFIIYFSLINEEDKNADIQYLNNLNIDLYNKDDNNYFYRIKYIIYVFFKNYYNKNYKYLQNNFIFKLSLNIYLYIKNTINYFNSDTFVNIADINKSNVMDNTPFNKLLKKLNYSQITNPNKQIKPNVPKYIEKSNSNKKCIYIPESVPWDLFN
jgi:hypothetical protein